jgi:hypothetical protein
MIRPEQFKDIQETILKRNELSFPSAPESLFGTGKKSFLDGFPSAFDDLSFPILVEQGGVLIRKIVEIGKDVTGSDLLRDVMKADLVKQAATGAVVGAGIAIAIPYSIVGLGAGAAVGAAAMSVKYLLGR